MSNKKLNSFQKKISELLNLKLIKYNISKKELAAYIKKSPVHITHITKSIKPIQPERLWEICNVLKTIYKIEENDIEDFIENSGNIEYYIRYNMIKFLNSNEDSLSQIKEFFQKNKNI